MFSPSNIIHELLGFYLAKILLFVIYSTILIDKTLLNRECELLISY